KDMSPADLSDEVKNTLGALKKEGIKIAIGSSSKNTPLILQRLGLENYFDAVSDGNNITASKPDPEVFLKAAVYLGENPADCLVVEDALSGIEAGRRGGFDTAAIGFAAKSDKATYTLNTFSDLLKYV
ncbi:MAG: HAD-IA family hydrolase, partial [Candidatus Coproplasma sp.]